MKSNQKRAYLPPVATIDGSGDLVPLPQEKECRRCVMRGPASLLALQNGSCRYCREYDANISRFCFTPEEERTNLAAIKATAEARRRRSEYDVVVGISGGVDSSYVAYLCEDLGLNTLLVHFDNGWNSKEAVENIRRVVDVTGFDLETYVVDWPEFRDLQRAFLRAGVMDIELLTDNAVVASSVQIARRNKIRTVLRGSNYTTEHGTPEDWAWAKYDWRNIKAIHRRYGERPLHSYPHLPTWKHHVIEGFNLGGMILYPLQKIEYSKRTVMGQLEERYGWKYYGGKHYESLFTRFYQAFILPFKFGIDKRLVYLSALVRIGDMSRSEALDESWSPLYEKAALDRDKRFVAKKLGFSVAEFDMIMAARPRHHLEFPSDQPYMTPIEERVRPIKQAMARWLQK